MRDAIGTISNEIGHSGRRLLSCRQKDLHAGDIKGCDITEVKHHFRKLLADRQHMLMEGLGIHHIQITAEAKTTARMRRGLFQHQFDLAAEMLNLDPGLSVRV